MKKRKWAILVCMVCMLLPVVGFFMIPGEIRYAEGIYTIISYFISTYTLIVTIGIAVIIYWLQKQDAMREEQQRVRRARSQMLLELENALELFVFLSPEDGGRYSCEELKECLQIQSGELRNYLTTQEFHHLAMLVHAIYRAAEENGDREELCGYVRDWLKLLFLTGFRGYLSAAFDYKELLDKRTWDLLQKLKGEQASYPDLDQICDMNGNLLLERKESYICIYDGKEKVLDGQIGYTEYDFEPVILEGYAKTKRYEGYYRNGKYDGNGTQFDAHHRVQKEGVWEQRELITGTEYDWLIRYSENKQDYEKMEQYGQEALTPFSYARSYIEHEGMEVYAVADLQVDHDREEPVHIRSLEAFLKQRNPEQLEMLREMIALEREEYSDQEYSSQDNEKEDQDSRSSMH